MNPSKVDRAERRQNRLRKGVRSRGLADYLRVRRRVVGRARYRWGKFTSPFLRISLTTCCVALVVMMSLLMIAPEARGYENIIECANAVICVYIFSLLCVVHVRRTHYLREIKGLCIHCGYDIRNCGTRCPECGVPMTENSGKAAYH